MGYLGELDYTEALRAAVCIGWSRTLRIMTAMTSILMPLIGL